MRSILSCKLIAKGALFQCIRLDYWLYVGRAPFAYYVRQCKCWKCLSFGLSGCIRPLNERRPYLQQRTELYYKTFLSNTSMIKLNGKMIQSKDNLKKKKDKFKRKA